MDGDLKCSVCGRTEERSEVILRFVSAGGRTLICAECIQEGMRCLTAFRMHKAVWDVKRGWNPTDPFGDEK